MSHSGAATPDSPLKLALESGSIPHPVSKWKEMDFHFAVFPRMSSAKANKNNLPAFLRPRAEALRQRTTRLRQK
jgi:hypothetical protein